MNKILLKLEQKAERLSYQHNISLDSYAKLVIGECIRMIECEASQYYEPVWALELTNNIKEYFGIADEPIKVGSRVRIVRNFSVGSTGTVKYIEPCGRLWVRRDGSDTDMPFAPIEVELLKE